MIHPNIDVKAQRALIQMLENGNGSDRVAAMTLIDWVDQGRLEGIFQPDQYVPAQAAKKKGGWWTMLKGNRARVFCEGPASFPILIFRKDLDRESLISVFRSVVSREGAAGCSIDAGSFCVGGPVCEAAFIFR